MKKIVSTSKKLQNLQRDYRVIKAKPEPTYTDGTVLEDLDPRTYLFNRDCLTFNKEVFKFLQLYSETSAKFRASDIFKFKTLTVDPDSGWKPKNEEVKKNKKKDVKKKKSAKSGDDEKKTSKKILEEIAVRKFKDENERPNKS